MFERLTFRDSLGVACYRWELPRKIEVIANEAISRLAAYEDSELSPREVQELAKAKQEGRLVVLPCKGISLREAFKTMQSECGCPLSDMGIDERLGDCRKDCFDCVCGCLAAKEAAEKALGGGEE